MYGGMASRRLDGSAIPMGAGIYAIGHCSASSSASACEQLRRELAGADRLGPAGQAHREILADLDLAARRLRARPRAARGAAQESGDGGAAGAGARGERLPHPALEDPRPHPVAVDARGRRRWCGSGTARGLRSPGRSRRGRGRRAPSSTTIAHCGLPIETCWNSQLAATGTRASRGRPRGRRGSPSRWSRRVPCRPSRSARR